MFKQNDPFVHDESFTPFTQIRETRQVPLAKKECYVKSFAVTGHHKYLRRFHFHFKFQIEDVLDMRGVHNMWVCIHIQELSYDVKIVIYSY